LWCRVWDTLCPCLDIIYVYIRTCPKTDIRSSKNRHKPSFTRRGHSVTHPFCSFADWRRRRLAKIVDRAHFIWRHSLNRNG
ncbi:hypothetical protein K443DRAFT_620786, partial [Laccaria amethystina LaAM-08-1]